MFTGIIECLGTIKSIQNDGENVHFKVASPISKELKVDQSISHNGVCLTVVEKDDHSHVVTAIKQTLDLSNLGELEEDSKVNLERCTQMNGRLDGHLVQGHVDGMATCTGIKDENGSWRISFKLHDAQDELMVPKGSITVNGTSLTLADVRPGEFDVAIIPYTFEETVFGSMKAGDTANIEYDIIGKYVSKWMESRS
ncbi:MAG: riboflavin synthase [Flavobacteriales bacterium]